MKNIISLIIIIILTISSLGTVALNNDYEFIEKTEIFRISTPLIYFDDMYTNIEIPEATSYLRNTGEPIIPKITKVYVLPFGSTVKSISVEFSEPIEKLINKIIKPASAPLIDGQKDIKPIKKSEKIYLNKELYPTTSYDYRTSTGLKGKEHVVFLTIEYYPVRYSPIENKVYYHEHVEINIIYNEPEKPIIFPDEYDLLIISPSEFSQELQQLVNHKNDHDIKTMYVSLEEIYSEQTDGRDDQEKIKLYIKKSIEEFGINYVLLVGGMIEQSDEWYLPIRNGHSPSEDSYISDLYYADIYKDNGTAFEDWDSNGNNEFAEYSIFSKDIIDGSPDVYVGRLACRSIDQVTIMVNKIINYENTPAEDSWFKRMLLIGGDTYPHTVDGFEAEIDTNLSASYMEGFEAVKLWASLGTLNGQEDVEQAINEGSGFIHMAGHANPSILVTYPPNDADKEFKIIILQMYVIPISEAYWSLFYLGGGISGFIEKLSYPRNPRLNNDEKLPIIVVGGCHNSQFNTSIYNILKGFAYAYGHGIHSPKCWSWWLTSKEEGGAIATMGNTGLGMGIADGGDSYLTGLDGWLFPRFFYHYGQLGEKHIGMAHSSAITDYVNEFDINTDGEDRQMVQQWVLLGDPTLFPGGYQN
jgi:hypothetical protein